MARVGAQTNAVQRICNEAHLRNNYRILKKSGPIFPVVKADAYGHGMLAVAKVLAEEGAEGLAVGIVQEGISLRQAGVQGEILVLTGALDLEEARLAIQYNLLLAVHSMACLKNLEEAACQLECENVFFLLKLDSGMGRLGFSFETLPALLARLQDVTRLTPSYVLSHHAAADSPALQGYVEKQVGCFIEMFRKIYEQFPNIRISFFNSAALHTAQNLLQVRLHESMGLSQEIWGRPGLALYGLNPFYGTPNESFYTALQPVMSLTAPVLSVRTVQAGESLSYGCTFKAPHVMRLAIVGIGYAHGYFRQYSNTASMVLCGVRAPVVGNVCMQMTILDCTHIEGLMQGDRAYVLGGPEGCLVPITAYELAKWAQTIPYEIICALGKNVGYEPIKA